MSEAQRRLRKLNLARSKAAGAPVGDQSELDRVKVAVRVRPRPAGVKKKLRKQQLALEKKVKGLSRAVREVYQLNPKIRNDAMAGTRRIPGSFEQGKRK